MRLSFVVCANGFGHLKRVVHVANCIKKMNSGHEVQLIISTNHVEKVRYFGLKTDDSSLTITPGGTESNLKAKLPDNYSFIDYLASNDSIAKSVNNFRPDKIISDNLVGIINHFPSIILMGSFLWKDVLKNSNDDQVLKICAFENDLLQKHKPKMLGLEDMVMPAVKEQTNFLGLPWFCDAQWHNQPYTREERRILLTGGGTGLITRELVALANSLIRKSKIRVFLDRLLMSEVNDSQFELFSFEDDDFKMIDCIICRPGIGILTDAVAYSIPIVAVEDNSNEEIHHNAIQMQKLGIGIIHQSISNTVDFIERLNSTVYSPSFKKLKVGGAEKAAEIILAE